MPVEFGDQITADHIIAHSERSMGVTGDKAAVVVGDRATGWFEGFPLEAKSEERTLRAFRQFMGSDTVKRAWSDNSGELIAALNTLRITHDTSLQGRPQSNGRAERLVRRVMDGAKTLLLQAGLPRGYWPYAMRSYCFAQNIDIVGGNSAYHRRHDLGQFERRSIPFGCLIDFKPQPSIAMAMPKGSPDTIPGVFFGYKLLPGGLWERLTSLQRFGFFGMGWRRNRAHSDGARSHLVACLL